jgi:hypothetical protein
MFSAKNGMTIEVTDPNNGTRVSCGQPNKTENEFWQIVPAQHPGINSMTSVNLKCFSGRNLDVYQNKAEQGAHVIIWDAHQDKNQIWIFDEKC